MRRILADERMAMSRASQLIRSAVGPALALLVIANFAGYAVLGSNGVLAWGDYRRQIGERSDELAALEAERATLAHRVTLLDPRRVDPDMADEMVRKELGVLRPDEVQIDLP